MTRNPSRRNPDPDFMQSLERAAEMAQHSLEAIAPERDCMLRILERFEEQIREASVQPAAGQNEAVQEAVRNFSEEFEKRRHLFEGLADRTCAQLAESYAQLERDAPYVTILLFGRTKAGKSTTLEALTAGDGTTIGTGRQHATRDIRAYYVPTPTAGDNPDQPRLRIVDTPGIEGFEGQELAEMAEKHVDHADHILFLISNDSADPEQLARFDWIQTRGKDLTVLLNVKEGDLELLADSPEEVFQPDEIKGHRRQIAGHLRRRFGLESPEVIPFHAHGGWKARSADESSGGVPSRTALERASGLSAVEKRLRRFVVNEAIAARRRAPRDLLNSYLIELKNELRPTAGAFRTLDGELKRLCEDLEKRLDRAHDRAAERLTQLRLLFTAAENDITPMVDDILKRRGSGRDLEAEWQRRLRARGVTEGVDWFIDAAQRDFIRELEEGVRVAAADFSLSTVRDLDGALDAYHEQQDTKEWEGYGRAGLRGGAGAAAGYLAWYGLANWWNPSGWVAIGGAAVAGLAAQEAARSVTEEWRASTNRGLSRHRQKIIKRLQERLRADRKRAEASCRDWLERAHAAHRDNIRGTVRPVQQAARRIHGAATTTLDSLDEVAARLNRHCVEELLHDQIPQVAEGRVHVTGVARQPSFATKIRVASQAQGVCPLGACIGSQGHRVKALREALGGERIEFVDAGAPLETQVRQALGMSPPDAACPQDVVRITRSGDVTIATVRCDQKQAGRLIGPKGANSRLAGELLGMKIRVQGA
ncbi:MULTISPECIES: GTPase [unclassified Halorhodospira]|uniref:GTPase n=1 Tax=unclassified Halorhodospira TaxID=2626748 RepID=UPI001EE85070|nr:MULTISPECIES: GTPase [unclassified Halorhodospira]MCG5541922.1 50S ribosome-binding GTPase [Halorhodospira sp. M39old]MCG5547001.1 50S ribosome-binding GTPase [Halorhodospira sp. M38]